MEQVKLQELPMETRPEVLGFLKKLWESEPTGCPFCGKELELLHKKAKKSKTAFIMQAAKNMIWT